MIEEYKMNTQNQLYFYTVEISVQKRIWLTLSSVSER